MFTISVRVCGDHWNNPNEVEEQLKAHAGQGILLDLNNEGPSLYSLGIVDVVQKYTDNVTVKNWSNTVESVPFKREFVPRLSHFFWMSERYQVDIQPLDLSAKQFGFFLGRKTISRGAIMYEIATELGQDFLLSCMNTNMPSPWDKDLPGVNLEKLSDWVIDQTHFKNWWATDPIKSIDNHAVGDQYNDQHNTNYDLLQFYKDFNIELVAETYTIGSTFFPTEKTVRPIMAGKPMLVYGPVNYLKNLKSLGFQTYSNFWDESYDQYQGPQRWQMIKQTINNVKNTNLNYNALALVAQHNREILDDLITRYRPVC